MLLPPDLCALAAPRLDFAGFEEAPKRGGALRAMGGILLEARKDDRFEIRWIAMPRADRASGF